MSGPLAALTPGFKEDLLGCFKDIPGCLFTWLCSPIVSSMTRTHIDGREWGWCDCCCGASPYAIRQAIRQKNGVEKDAVKDCLTVWLCQPCAVYQSAKEAGAKMIPEGEELKRL